MTTQLPESLAPWRNELALFPVDLAIDLGALVRRLSSAIGAPVAVRHRGDDPDGYDGIVRSGAYDRMLHSEWLYADELPDEFLRRTVMREQLFFRIARRSPLDELFSVALFDAGPTQLGSARILHLALLIVLARRCAERGGTFRWGVLQQHPRRVYEQFDADAVRAMLDLRSVREVEESDLDEWADLLPHGDKRHRETWLAGGERLARLVDRHAHVSTGRDYREASIVAIDQPIDSGERTLLARIRTARGEQRKLTLQLPEERTAIRLIRDPFEVTRQSARAAEAAAPASTDMMFAAGGKRLIGTAPDGGVIVHLIPHGAVKHYQAMVHERVVAAGWGRRKAGVSIALLNEQPLLRVGRIHRHPPTQVVAPQGALPKELFPDKNRLLPVIATSTQSSRPQDFLFLDAHGGCWMTNCAEESATCITVGVAAMLNYEGHPHLATLRGDEWLIMRIEGDTPRILARFSGRGPSAFFGTPAGDRKDGLLAALQQDETKWLVVSDEGVRTNAPPPESRVIGITSTRLSRGPALVVVERFSISFVHGRDISTVITTTRPIVSACLDSETPRVAYVTAGSLYVTSLENSDTHYRATVTS